MGTKRTFSKNGAKRIRAITTLYAYAGTLQHMQTEREHSTFSDDEPDQSRFDPILAENVRRMRSYSNITKTRLALMVEIGRPLLNKIENGTSNARLATITKLADSLDTTPAFLLTQHTDEEIRVEIECRKTGSRENETRHARLY